MEKNKPGSDKEEAIRQILEWKTLKTNRKSSSIFIHFKQALKMNRIWRNSEITENKDKNNLYETTIQLGNYEIEMRTELTTERVVL